jgi:hypothetical protein
MTGNNGVNGSCEYSVETKFLTEIEEDENGFVEKKDGIV